MVKLAKNLISDLVQDKLILADPWYQLVIKMLQPVFPDLDGRKLLEVGCGLGGFSLNAAKKGAMVVGLDVSSNAIHMAKSLAKQLGVQGQVDFIIGDAQFLPFKEQTSEITVCSETLEHIPNFEKAFHELVRITNKLGYLCLTVPNFLSTAFFENVILLLIGQPKYVKSHVCVEKEHIFHIFKLKRLLNRENVRVLKIRSVDFLHLPPRVRKVLKVSQSLKIISDRIEGFVEAHAPPFRLLGANIGVLARKE